VYHCRSLDGYVMVARQRIWSSWQIHARKITFANDKPAIAISVYAWTKLL